MEIGLIHTNLLDECYRDNALVPKGAHSSKLHEGEYYLLRQYVQEHGVCKLSDVNIADYTPFVLTIFDNGCTKVLGFMLFQKNHIEESPLFASDGNVHDASQIHYELKYLLIDERLLCSDFLKHAITIALHSLVDRQDAKHEYVIWFSLGEQLYARKCELVKDENRCYFTAEACYFADILSSQTRIYAGDFSNFLQ